MFLNWLSRIPQFLAYAAFMIWGFALGTGSVWLGVICFAAGLVFDFISFILQQN